MKKIFIANAELTKPLLPNIHGKKNIPLYRNQDELTEFITTVEVVVENNNIYALLPEAVMHKFVSPDPDVDWDFRLQLNLDIKRGTTHPFILGELYEIDEGVE